MSNSVFYMQLKYVTFYGDDCSGIGQYGTTCTELMNEGISEIVYDENGRYLIYFMNKFDSSNYIVLSTSNVAGTGGAPKILVGIMMQQSLMLEY